MIINKDYKIESDSMNIILLEKCKGVSKKTGEPSKGYTPIGYFSTPANALKFLADHEIKGTGFNDMKTITAKQQEIYTLISGLDMSKITQD